jgi:hypothetical protein
MQAEPTCLERIMQFLVGSAVIVTVALAGITLLIAIID